MKRDKEQEVRLAKAMKLNHTITVTNLGGISKDPSSIDRTEYLVKIKQLKQTEQTEDSGVLAELEGDNV